MNEYCIILRFVFYACICQRVNTVRVCIIILHVNSTTVLTYDLCNQVRGENIHIFRYWYRLSAK